VFELMADSGDTSAIARANSFMEGMAAYMERDFAKAHTLFMEHAKKFPDDRAAWPYIHRCAHFVEDPPLADWDGIFDSSVLRERRGKMDR
jgi:hypothetical protein